MRSRPVPRGSKPIRHLRSGFLVVLAAVVSSAPGALAAANAPVRASAQAVRTVAQDARGATFDVVPGPARFDSVNVGGALYTRVSLPGAVVLEAPGRPSLPSLPLYVAVPDGMSPRVRVIAEEWDTRPGTLPIPVARQRFHSDTPAQGTRSELSTDPDPAAYRGSAYPAEAAALGGSALVGNWWVAAVNVHPVRWDPQAAAYRVLRTMTVRVDFVAASERELAARPAARPAAQARAWDRVQRGLVRNYEAARAFPRRPSRSGTLGAAPLGGSRASGARLAGNPEWKLSVVNSGWVSVSYSSLVAGGFPSGIAIANVRVEERGYDDNADVPTVAAIPVVARDNNGNGTFDAGDAITFYARSLRDRVGTGNIELRYSDVNVYWLTWDVTPGPRPAPITGDIPGTATAASSFRDVIRLEQDHFAKMAVPNNVTSPPEAIEYLFWTDGGSEEAGDQIDIPLPFVDPDPTQPFRIRARYQGKGYLSSIIHHLDVFFRGSTGVVDTLAAGFEFVDQDIWLLDTGFTIPGSDIGPGTNFYRHLGRRRNGFGAPLVVGSSAFLDVVEATYSRLYRAQNNYLRFTSGNTAGLVEIHVDGFTSATPPNIEVYDVTNPLSADSVTATTVSQTAPNTWNVSFRTDASAGERRFVALVPGAETPLSGTSVVADVSSGLRQPGAFGAGSMARSILITPQAFRAESDRLANFRRAQGYVVEVADITDVFDEFNGGVKSPRAIRRYLRHAWQAWTPQPMYVILAGDGSLDYKKHLSESSFDWVPTYFKFSTIPDNSGPELVAQDPYYSLNLSAVEPGSNDFVPSLSLTRIPAGNLSELREVVDKIIAYENFQPTDSWRGRQVLYSDDEYSRGIVATRPYCFDGQETDFKNASVDVASITASSPGGVDIVNVPVDLKTYTDAVPAPGGCKNINDVLALVNAPGNAIDALLAEMNQGALIFNLETHANRYLISHETVLTNGTPIFAPNSKGTPDQIQNVGRPWYMMVWGCHTNQFADGPFMSNNALDSLDAIGEQYLLMSNRGAIAALGSTALEYLPMNKTYNEYAAQAFYQMPPAPDPPPGDRPEARWILGEVMLLAQAMNGVNGPFEQMVMNRTVHLFADPMLRMDALPPRLADVTVGGTSFADNAPLTSDSPTDSLALLAHLRDEVGIDSVYVTEQDVATNAITPIDPATYSVTFADSSRTATLTGNVRPRVGNYDLQIRAIDINGRMRTFTMQVRTPIRYFANGVEIVNGVFVQNGSTLRAEVTAPIPLTADSLSLRIDGIPVAATITKRDTPGRQWALEFVAADLFTGSHTIAVAIGGRTLEQRTFTTTSEFTMRGVAIVDPRIQGTGCGGSIFQYELSATARKVELQLFTVAGRLFNSLDLPGQAGFNVFCWDGRDSRAHDTAQGVYLYRLRATDTNGKSVTQDGRMIRVR